MEKVMGSMFPSLWGLFVWGFQAPLAGSSATSRVVFTEKKPWPAMTGFLSVGPVFPLRVGF